MSSADFQSYYFSDSYYQLELNLQTIRLALIYLLEESEDMECFKCNSLRCCCVGSYSSVRSSSLSDLAYSFSDLSSSSSLADMDYIFITAPPAETLPMPVWPYSNSQRTSPDIDSYKDIEKWVRASTPRTDGELKFVIDDEINNEVNTSWPPAPSSIWCESPSQEVGTNERVDAFFKYFAEMSNNRGYSYF